MAPTKEELIDRTLLADEFLANHLGYRNDARRRGQEQHKLLCAAHQRALSAVVSYQQRIQGQGFDATSKSLNERMALAAQFIQGIGITESAISEALYPQAANLMKQQLETLLAIDEIEEALRRDGKTPGFKGKLRRWGKFYGRLNELAHPSRHEVIKQFAFHFTKESSGPTPIPQYDRETFARLYGTQALMLCIFFVHLEKLFVEAFYIGSDDVEHALVVSAKDILLAEGIGKL